jgi:hypothetical protein
MVELSGAFSVQSTVINRWKRYDLENLSSLLSEKMKEKDCDNEEVVATLYQQIG